VRPRSAKIQRGSFGATDDEPWLCDSSRCVVQSPTRKIRERFRIIAFNG
jgi:hypothetical protein